MTTERPGVLRRVLNWLRAGYPHGIPREDYVALLGVLRRHLTSTEVTEVVQELIDEHELARLPVQSEEIRQAIAEHLLEEPTNDDIERVSARLASVGWPLGVVPDAEHEAAAS